MNCPFTQWIWMQIFSKFHVQKPQASTLIQEIRLIAANLGSNQVVLSIFKLFSSCHLTLLEREKWKNLQKTQRQKECILSSILYDVRSRTIFYFISSDLVAVPDFISTQWNLPTVTNQISQRKEAHPIKHLKKGDLQHFPQWIVLIIHETSSVVLQEPVKQITTFLKQSLMSV